MDYYGVLWLLRSITASRSKKLQRWHCCFENWEGMGPCMCSDVQRQLKYSSRPSMDSIITAALGIRLTPFEGGGRMFGLHFVGLPMCTIWDHTVWSSLATKLDQWAQMQNKSQRLANVGKHKTRRKKSKEQK